MNIFSKAYSWLLKPREVVLDGWDIVTKPLSSPSNSKDEEMARQLLINYINNNYPENSELIIANSEYGLNTNPLIQGIADLYLNTKENFGIRVFMIKDKALVESPTVEDPFHQV
jgi:hypothetical protein